MNTNAPAPVTVRKSSIDSAGRSRSGPRLRVVTHSNSSGATIKAPAASPSHHVSQIAPNCRSSASPVSTKLVTPIVALIEVLTRPASTENATMSRARLNAASPFAYRLTRNAPATASSVLPAAMPSELDDRSRRRDVDQKGADENGGRDSVAKQQHRGQCDTRRWPYGRGARMQECELKSKLACKEVDNDQSRRSGTSGATA